MFSVMDRKWVGVLLCGLLCLPLSAEIITLRSGKTLSGTILMQNEEVVIIQTAEGTRFQYPRSEVVKIETPVQEEETVSTEKPVVKKPVACRLFVNGGVAYNRLLDADGTFGATLQIGTRNLGNRRIFLGGSIGYQGGFWSQKKHFIPLQAVVAVPLMQGKHAPEIGAAIGYGFAPKGQKGGLAAGVQLLWRYQFKENTALLVGWDAQFQQGNLTTTETILPNAVSEDSQFTHTIGGTFVFTAFQLGLQF